MNSIKNEKATCENCSAGGLLILDFYQMARTVRGTPGALGVGCRREWTRGPHPLLFADAPDFHELVALGDAAAEAVRLAEINGLDELLGALNS